VVFWVPALSENMLPPHAEYILNSWYPPIKGQPKTQKTAVWVFAVETSDLVFTNCSLRYYEHFLSSYICMCVCVCVCVCTTCKVREVRIPEHCFRFPPFQHQTVSAVAMILYWRTYFQYDCRLSQRCRWNLRSPGRGWTDRLSRKFGTELPIYAERGVRISCLPHTLRQISFKYRRMGLCVPPKHADHVTVLSQRTGNCNYITMSCITTSFTAKLNLVLVDLYTISRKLHVSAHMYHHHVNITWMRNPMPVLLNIRSLTLLALSRCAAHIMRFPSGSLSLQYGVDST
jgi:hypothetical protein